MSEFTWMSLIPGVADHTATATLVFAFLISIAWIAKRQLAAVPDPVIPDAALTLRGVSELFVEATAKLASDTLGGNARPFIALYGSFFLFIVSCNLIGLLPGFAPPTSNFNVTFALGVCSFLMYNYYGLSLGGVEYVKHFVGPIWWLGVLMVPLELIDNLVRPLSLALRLFGNMNGDHLVLRIFTDMTYLGIPVLFYVLGALVSLIQAFVFTLLSLVYLSLALPHANRGRKPRGARPPHPP